MTTLPVERLEISHTAVKKLGPWTRASRVELRGRRSAIVLDLRSLPISPDGELEVDVDLERSSVKLLVPREAVIDHAGLDRIGRGGVKDGRTIPTAGRRIRLTGRLQHCTVHIHRGDTTASDREVIARFLADLSDRLHARS